MNAAKTSSLTNLARQRSVQVATAVWVGCSLAVFPLSGLSGGKLPFNRPMLAGVPTAAQVLTCTFQLLFVFLLMALTWLLTRRRQIPDMAGRAPAAGIARREVWLLLLYGALVLAAGHLAGLRLFGEGIGLHLNGSLFGPTRLQTPREVWFWAIYNFIFWAVVPYAVFRRRGYSREQMNLKSTDVRNDALVVLVILGVEAAGELYMSGIFRLSAGQILAGGALSFILHLFGTGLPVMIFIFSILLPRYLRLSGSTATTMLLGALTYAALHVFEYWTVYDSLPHAALSLIFVLLTFFGPGLIKSYLTLRTGNAWVHLWAYHAIAPHVTMDTPTIVKVFHLN
jgi:hypothetical protein